MTSKRGNWKYFVTTLDDLKLKEEGESFISLVVVTGEEIRMKLKNFWVA